MQRSWFRVAAYVGFAAVTAAVAWRTYADCNVVGQPDLPRFGMQDFRDAVYYPARAFLDGVSAYDPHPYLERYPVSVPLGPYAPAVLLLYAPLTLLDVRAAEVVFFLLNVGLALVLARTILVLCERAPTRERVLALGAILLLSHPGHSTLFLGQCTFYVVIGALLALHWGRTRPWAAALAFGVTVLKPTFGAPLGLMMMALGMWLPVLAGGLACGLVSLLALGRLAVAADASSVVRSFVGSLGHVLALGVNKSHTSLRIDVPGLVERISGIDASGSGGVLVTLTVLVLGIVASRRVARLGSGDDRQLVWALICLTVLGCTYHQGYDVLLLALPATALALAVWRPAEPFGPSTWAVLLACLAFPGVNYVSTYHFATRFGVIGPWWLVLASANGVAIAIALALGVAVAYGPREVAEVPRRAVSYR